MLHPLAMGIEQESTKPTRMEMLQDRKQESLVELERFRKLLRNLPYTVLHAVTITQ